MIQTIRCAPDNSLVFITDRGGGSAAQSFKADPIMSTPTCISVGTLAQHAGETSISLAHVSELETKSPTAFDGVLETPQGAIIVHAVDLTVLLFGHSGSSRTRVKVWTNHPTEPDEILIGFERA